MLWMLNNVSSVALIFASWWLCHSYAQQRERTIAIGLALIGLSTMATMVSRNVPGVSPEFVSWQIVFTKVAAAGTFSALAVRRGKREITIAKMMHDHPPAPMPPNGLKRLDDAVSRRRT